MPVLHPPDDQGQDLLLQLGPVSDEVVIDKEHVASPPVPVQGIHLRDHLCAGFRARQTSVENRDVAELTVVRAAARVLDIHRGVLAAVDQLPHGQRGRGQIRPLIGCVQVFRLTAPEVIEKQRQRDLRLVQDEVVHTVEFLMPGGEQRSAGDDLRPHLIAARDDRPGGFRLDGHPAEEDVVGPPEILGGERGQIEIDQPLLPFNREQRGNGQQPQRRLPGLLGDEPKGVLEGPECVRIFGTDEKDIHRGPFPGGTMWCSDVWPNGRS